jgi:hypothetical protein
MGLSSAERMPGRRAGVLRYGVALAIAGVVLAVALIVLLSRQENNANPIRLAMFYRPLVDGPGTADLASQLGVAVLTRTDEAYRDVLRDAGFQGPILQYLLANQTSGPPELINAGSPCSAYPSYPNNPSGISGDFCTALHGDERNFLHNGRGERLYATQAWQEDGATRRAYLYLMNPGAPGWQSYVAARVREEIATLGYSGIFLDNVDLSLHRGRRQQMNSDGAVAEYASDADYQKGVAEFLRAVRADVGTAPLWANLTNGTVVPIEWDAYLLHLDGVMQESFVAGWEGKLADPETWNVQVRQAETVVEAGKGFMAVAQGERDEVSRMRFALATYLLIAGDGASFRYADGSGGENTSPEYYTLWMYDEYWLTLGPAQGPRYWDGQVWRRDFACGSVTVHVEQKRGTIEGGTRCGPSFPSLLARILSRKTRSSPEYGGD